MTFDGAAITEEQYFAMFFKQSNAKLNKSAFKEWIQLNLSHHP